MENCDYKEWREHYDVFVEIIKQIGLALQLWI